MNQPSETVRYLASYLIDHSSEFFDMDSWHTDSLREYLAEAIQEFYDKLP